MKLSKLAAGLFAAAGIILLAGSIVLCLTSWNRSAASLQPPEAAQACAEAVMEAVDSGDFAAAAKFLYGQPDLGVDREPAQEAGKLLWQAYRDSISVEFQGDCYGAESDFYRDARVTALDIAGVTAQLDSRASGLLQQRLESAEDPEQVLGENQEVPQALKEEILMQALNEALAQAENTVTRDVTLKLVNRDGQWGAVPDKALLEILSGGLN